MEYKDLNIDYIKEQLESAMFQEPQQRKIKMYTNAYGADQFEEALMENVTGKKRMYLGFKVARFLKKAPIDIMKSNYTKRYYKLV